MEAVAVIGAGLMGHGIAQVFAAAGHPVAITDVEPDVLATVHARVRSNLERAGQDLATVERIQCVASMDEAATGAVLVVEAVAEDIRL
jgi:3-hydroxybutyryl-CoA dehydrogenase